MQTVEDIEVAAAQVGVEDQGHAIPPHGPPGVGAQDPLRAHPVFGPGAVFHRVGWLHGGDQPQLPEAGEVVGVDHLGVLDAVPEGLRLGVLGRRSFVEVQDVPVPAVSDGVDHGLETRRRWSGPPGLR